MKTRFDTEKICKISPEQMEDHRLLERSQHSDKFYNCVYCPSGTGKNKSGALTFVDKGTHWEHYCHRCGNGGNNITLFKQIFGGDFVSACKKASEEFGIPLLDGDGNYYYSTRRHDGAPPTISDTPATPSKIATIKRYPMPKDTTPPEQVPLIQADIAEAKENLRFLANEQRRGLEYKTLEYFGVGYLERWIHPKSRLEGKNYWSRRIIIPTSDGKHYHALALNMDRHPDDDPKVKSRYKMHAGSKTQAFNSTDFSLPTVIICEGEINLMSMFQACFANSEPGRYFPRKQRPVGMVATFGVNGWKRVFVPFIDAGYEMPRQYIILYDNDEAGYASAAELQAALKERNRRVVVKYLADYLNDDQRKILPDKVDANDILLKFGNDTLRDIIAKIVREANAAFAEMRDKERGKQTKLDIDAPILVRDDPRLASGSFMSAEISEQIKNGGKVTYHVFVPDPEIDYPKPKTESKPDETDTKPSTAEQIQAESASDTQDEIPARNSAIPDNTADDTAQSDADNAANPAIDDTTAKPSNAEQIQAESAFVTDAAIPDDTDAKLKEWQAQFGDIDPRYMPNIKQAQEFLQNVSTDNLTVDKALSLQTKNALAISKFYSYLEPLFNRFFVVVEQKKRAAVNKLQISRLDGGGLIADDTDAIAWKNFSVRELKNAVVKITRAIAQTHKDFRRAEKRRIAEEQNLARQNARNEAVQRNLDELMHLRDEPPSVDRDYKLRELILDTVEWKVNHHGDRIAVNNTAANLHTIMSFDPDLCGLVGYDEFKGVNTFLRQPPWRDEPCIGDKWRNDDDALVRMFLRTHYPEFKDDKLIADAIIQYSRQYAFHEVKDFIYGLPTWDGKERLATIFIKFLGVKDTPLNRAITINWFMGLFARLFYPGCDYQICLVLPGGQRIGKSRLLRMLAGALGVNPRGKDWHISLTDSLDDSHAIDAIKNGWIIELEEGAATSKADIKAIKRFISAESDTRRFAYGKHAETVKRHCVIAITINGESFLRDTTGNARFYVLQCTKENFKQVDGMTPTYIRQCLAEGYHMFKELFANVKADDTYKISELLRLPLEFQVENESRNAAYMQDDGMMSQTLAWLDMKIPPQVIWNLFTREERSRFCSQGKITLPNALDDLIIRRKLGAWRDQRKDIDAIRDYINDKEYCRKTEGTRTDGSDAGYTIYGSEYRQHVCPAEILNEAFAANDRRKNPARINEIFSALKGEGWIEGKTIDREPVYKRQNKVLWRSLTNVPEPAPAKTENNNNDYDFGGEPIPNDDCPFDPDDLPI